MHYPGDLSHLGLPVGEYRPRWHTYLLTAIGTGVFITGIIGLMLHQTGLSLMTGSEWAIVITVAFFGVVCVLTFGIQALSNKRRRFLLFDHGFVDQRGNQTEVYAWDDIKATRFKSIAGNGLVMVVMRLDCHDGRKFKFEGTMSNSRASGAAQSSFRSLGKLDMLDIIMNSGLPHRLADARARLAGGEQVAFGQLVISQIGIHTRRRMLPWHQISGVKMQSNSLTVWQTGHRRRWDSGT
jgi:hypothetical protein